MVVHPTEYPLPAARPDPRRLTLQELVVAYGDIVMLGQHPWRPDHEVLAIVAERGPRSAVLRAWAAAETDGLFHEERWSELRLPEGSDDQHVSRIAAAALAWSRRLKAEADAAYGHFVMEVPATIRVRLQEGRIIETHLVVMPVSVPASVRVGKPRYTERLSVDIEIDRTTEQAVIDMVGMETIQGDFARLLRRHRQEARPGG